MNTVVPKVTLVFDKYELRDLLTLTAGGINRMKDHLNELPEKDIIAKQFTMEHIVKLKFLLEKLEGAEDIIKKVEQNK
jgi:hypothetical protein